MAKSIPISPKHGLNPTIPICFFCGKERSEIALLGKLPNDAEAPRYAIIDYEPCDECKTAMASGITLIGTTFHPNTQGQPPITNKPQPAYPTGSWVVLREEAVDRIFTEETAATLKTTRKAYVEQAELLKFMPPTETTME